jgi:hypothetical protein
MNRRDIELLSAYLDGELKPSDSTRLEARLKTDPELASILTDLRAARTLLRKLPSRKAPRNFTLTRKMVGQNPPLPRTYPFFRLATVVATLLFFFSFGINSFGSQLASQAPAFGMGGGGESESLAQESAPVAEEPAAAAPMAPAPAEPEVADSTGEEPSISFAAPQGTEIPPTDDAIRILETPFAKNGETENAVGQDQLPPADDASQTRQAQAPSSLIPSVWQIGLAAVAMLGLLLMGWMRRSSVRRWK